MASCKGRGYAVEPLIDTDDVVFKPKSTRTIKGKIVSRERGKFITEIEPLIKEKLWQKS